MDVRASTVYNSMVCYKRYIFAVCRGVDKVPADPGDWWTLRVKWAQKGLHLPSRGEKGLRSVIYVTGSWCFYSTIPYQR
jgi:hypothetical protein